MNVIHNVRYAGFSDPALRHNQDWRLSMRSAFQNGVHAGILVSATKTVKTLPSINPKIQDTGKATEKWVEKEMVNDKRAKGISVSSLRANNNYHHHYRGLIIGNWAVRLVRNVLLSNGRSNAFIPFIFPFRHFLNGLSDIHTYMVKYMFKSLLTSWWWHGHSDRACYKFEKKLVGVGVINYSRYHSLVLPRCYRRTDNMGGNT